MEKKKAKKTKSKVKSVSKFSNSRISSGISTLNKQIEGGFEKNSINLIVGEPGAGKSILCLQFLLDGVDRGEPCLYINFEETKKDFYTNMLPLGWDLQKLEDQGKFFFMEYTPEKVKTMLEEGGGIIESLVLTKKIKRVVIDSISSFELLFIDDIRKREAALALFGILRKWDCTTLLTYESEGDKNSTFQVLDFESDSTINLTTQKKGNERKKFLEITKMRGTNHSTKTHVYEIKKGGIVLKG